jgi:copper chaperone
MKLKVIGMTCGHCASSVKAAIATLDPAATVTVDIRAGEVSIDGNVTEADARSAIRNQGYQVPE